MNCRHLHHDDRGEQETALRAAYHEAAAEEPRVDVWPCVSTRLSSVPARPRPFRALRQWAWSAAAATVVIAACGLFHSPVATRPAQVAVPVVAPGVGQEGIGLPANAAAIDTLADVPRVNPAIDDPARSSVEQIWVQLGNRPTSEAQSQ